MIDLALTNFLIVSQNLLFNHTGTITKYFDQGSENVRCHKKGPTRYVCLHGTRVGLANLPQDSTDPRRFTFGRCFFFRHTFTQTVSHSIHTEKPIRRTLTGQTRRFSNMTMKITIKIASLGLLITNTLSLFYKNQ